MQIKNISFEDKSYHFFEDTINESDNLYTILVGRNGAGKSRVLQKICHLHLNLLKFKNQNKNPSVHSFLDTNSSRSFNDTSHLNYGKINYLINGVDFEFNVKKIDGLNTYHTSSSIIETKINDNICQNITNIKKLIAVSNNPFDKFPIPDRNFAPSEKTPIEKHYIYRGARIKTNSQKDYLKTKFDQLGSSLINFFLNFDKTKNKISILLDTLGIKEEISLHFTFPFHFHPLEVIKNKEQGVKRISDSLNSIRFFKDRGGVLNLSEEEEELIIYSLKSVVSFFNLQNSMNEIFSLDLNLYNTDAINDFDLLNSLSLLAHYDLVDLLDIKFIKNTNCFYLTEASSGELSLIFNLLSIAGEIEDDSLILIDEPEVSLHPEWQGSFLPLLNKMFSEYKGCHFIIATHSPQILSSIENKQTFIINLENNNHLIKGEELSEKSADYQLAYVFKEPGNKNEYLTRIALTVFTNVSKNKAFSSNDSISLNLLLENIQHMNTNDPLHQLIKSLEEMRNLYA